MKLFRRILGYAAMAVAVTVGGVVVGAIVVAPAVQRGKPLFERAFKSSTSTEGSGGAVGQADGDPMSQTQTPSIAAVAPFKPLAEVIASDRKAEVTVLAPRRTAFVRLKYEMADRFDDLLLAAARVPKIFWLYADIGAVLLMAGVWTLRRRRSANPVLANPVAVKSLDRGLRSLSGKTVSGKGSRTPKAVASLAEAGNSPADIARRTGLALDAVAMLISMGGLNPRQLQPPTA